MQHENISSFIQDCHHKLEAALVVREWHERKASYNNKTAHSFIQRCLKRCVNVELERTDAGLRNEGASYTHIVYGNVTKFDRFLSALVNSVTSEVARDIKGCHKIE